jgi:xylulokinase
MTRLGVSPIADHTSASRWLLMDLDQLGWSPEILEAAEVLPALLPAIAPSGSEIGTVAGGVAEATGLQPGAAIVTGGYDQACATLGAGARSFGDTVVGTGTWEVLTSLVDVPTGKAATERGAATGAFALPGQRCAYALNPGGGSIVDWYRDRFRQDTQPVSDLIDEMPESPAPVLSLPHFQGSGTAWADPESRGAVLGLSWATTGPDLLLSLLEGITFELRANLELLEAAGARIGTIRNTGGGARSARWVQLKADVLGRPFETVDVDEPGCLAAACLAGAGIGRLASADAAIAGFVHVARRFEPDTPRTERYAERYALYRRLYAALAPISHELLLEGRPWHP